MSKAKVGDRVRVVIEDEVIHVSNDESVVLKTGQVYAIGWDEVVSIDVIPPPFVLPTKRWAQVLREPKVDHSEILWTRRWCDDEPQYRVDEQWFNDFGGGSSSADLINLAGLRVISEGVDE